MLRQRGAPAVTQPGCRSVPAEFRCGVSGWVRAKAGRCLPSAIPCGRGGRPIFGESVVLEAGEFQWSGLGGADSCTSLSVQRASSMGSTRGCACQWETYD